MSLRAAARILREYERNLGDKNNSPEQATNAALRNLADGLFDEFGALHRRLDALEGRLQRLESLADQRAASG